MRGKTIEYLKKCKVFYIATVDGDKPRVRPFGVVIDHEGKFYFTTANTKPVFHQLQTNPHVEICACDPAEMSWLRLCGKAVFDPNPTVKKMAFYILPALAEIYGTPENPDFEVFYLIDAEVSFCTLGQPCKTYKL